MKWNLLSTSPIGGPNNPASSDALRLARELDVSPIVAQLLINRGIKDSASAHTFLKPDLNNLSDPMSLPGVKTALERIDKALKHKEKIVIYGDYDTDGVTATALLISMFKFIDTEVDYYLPNRLEEGYGLNKNAIKKIVDSGANLMITVDCGITDIESVAYAKELGLDIIVTDHHEPVRDEKNTIILPDAIAIINPKIISGNPMELSGVGVAFKLAWAFSQQFTNSKKQSPEFQAFLTEAIALVVVGTITDVSELSGENRILTAYGMPLLKNISVAWLDALIEKSRIKKDKLAPDDISFRIGPRLNASGRLGNAQTSLELLLCKSKRRALEMADELEKNNQNRQRIEKKILESVREKVLKKINLKKDYAIVLGDESWHIGVLGIVASKIADEFNRPTVLFTIKGTRAKGSARSIQAFHLYEGLQHCHNLLVKYGGHSYAAGIEIETDNIEIFRDRLNEYAHSKLAEADLEPALQIDTEVLLSQLNYNSVRQIEQLMPFGEGNPEPVLISRNVEIAGTPNLVGANDEHCSFVVKQSGTQINCAHRVIAFNLAKKWDEFTKVIQKPFQIAYIPKIDTWSYQPSIVLHLRDFKALS
jgi:single-stranded-DNA-specific exonuclease